MDREKVVDELNTDVLPFLQHYCDMQCDREKRWISRMIITVHDALALLKEQEAMNVDAFVQWCIDSHIMGDATVRGIKYWVGKYKETKKGR